MQRLFIRPYYRADNRGAVPDKFAITRTDGPPLTDSDVVEFFDVDTPVVDIRNWAIECGPVPSMLAWGTPMVGA